ncbi:MAG: sialidase family protein [Candidatus Sigynarchaeota archaeon]
MANLLSFVQPAPNTSFSTSMPVMLKPSVVPQLMSPFKANTSVISPKNDDGINDAVAFSFTTNINTVYNITIEEDLRMVNSKSRHVAVGGNASRMIMVSAVDDIDPARPGAGFYNVTTRESTNGGMNWSAPVQNSLSHEYDELNSVWAHRYSNFDIEYNQSAGTFFLMMVDEPSLISDNITIQLFGSFDGISWYFISMIPDINVTGIVSDLNIDMVLSPNGTEILGIITKNQGIPHRVYFIKSTDGGYSWVIRVIDSAPPTGACYSPAIAMSPTTGSITCIWFNGTIGSCYYYLSRSMDFGQTWSLPLRLDMARGIGQSNTPSYAVSSYGTFRLLYEPLGLLRAFIIMNRSTLLYAESNNDGINWINGKKFRSFGTDVHVYAMNFKAQGDGNSSLCFTSSLNGNVLSSSHETYASAYYLRPRIVHQQFGISASGGIPETFVWTGRDSLGRFVEDAPYLARVTARDAGSSDIVSEKMEARVFVDNERMDVIVTQKSQYFSPLSSPGIMDTMDFEITSAEDGNIDVFIDGEYTARAQVRATTSDVQDFRGDTAIDRTGRLWCVYTSYEGGNGMDLYLKKSDDQGNTFSISQPLVASPYSEDCPAIAIYGDSIYVVFQQFHPALNNPFQEVYDILMIQSDDLGRTWMYPRNLTAAEFNSANYFAPDIVVRENGTIIISWCRSYGALRQIECIRSINGTFLYSSPTVICSLDDSTSITPVALAIDEAMDVVYAGVGRLVGNNSPFVVYVDYYSSVTNGLSWTFLSSFTENSQNDGLFRGITLDVYSTGILRSRYLIWLAKVARLVTLESFDGGTSWFLAGSPLILQTTDLVSTPGYPYACDLRSGKSPRGSILYTFDLHNANTDNRDVFISFFTTETQHLFVPVYKATPRVISWNGFDYWGNMISGFYTITIVATDVAGNKVSNSYLCLLDNEVPQIQYETIPLAMLSPSQNVTVPIRKIDTYYDYEVTLCYRHALAGNWTVVPAAFNGTHYTVMIPASSFYEVYFFANATDFAGNSINLPQCFYFKPNPIVEFVPGTEDPKRLLDADMQIQVSGLPVSNLTHIYLDYMFDGAKTPTRVEMLFDNNTLKYTITLPGSQQHTSLKYSVVIVRYGSNITEEIYQLLVPITQDYIPAFPEINITYPGNVIIVIISAVVGLAFGLMQAHGKMTSMKKLKARFDLMERSGGQFSTIDRGEDTNQLRRGRLMYNAMMAGTLATIGGGLFATFVLNSGGSAMLIAGFGLLLSSLALKERVSLDAADAIFAGRRASFLPIILNTGLIIAVLAVFMVAGPRVDWFNYYIVLESFTLGGISIPKLWLSLITPVITSVLLIVVSSYRDLKNSLKRFDAMQAAGESWRVIWQAKEETISKLNSNVTLKMFVFLVTIVFALVSTTQIGQYAEEGMLFLVPFIIAWLAVSVIAMFAIPSKQYVVYGKSA